MRLLAELVVVVVVAVTFGLGGVAFGSHRQGQLDLACQRALVAQVQTTGSTRPLPLACGIAILSGAGR